MQNTAFRTTILVLLFGLSLATQTWGSVTAGLEAYKQGDYAAAFKEWTLPAEQGHMDAQYYMGLLYLQGLGMKRDFAQARFWFEKAAEQGHYGAQHNLGTFHVKGLGGLKRDERQAVEWFTIAADRGYRDSKFILGLCYLGGQGVPHDVKKGLELVTRAAELGLLKAQNDLATIYQTGIEGVPQDYQKAKFWYEKAADKGLAASQANLGYMYYTGQGGAQDYVLAKKWIKKSRRARVTCSNESDGDSMRKRIWDTEKSQNGCGLVDKGDC